MTLKNLLNITIQASKGNEDLNKGIVGINGYGFLFRDLSYLEQFYDIRYSSGLCYIGSTRDLVSSWNKNRQKFDLMEFYSDRIEDLYYIGAIKTLVPSIQIGGDESLFEVGVLIATPYEKLFPATFYWRKGMLVLAGMKKELLCSFQGFKGFNLVDIAFTNDELNELAEAFEFALQKVPLSDFEADYFDDEYGTMRIGLDSGVPYMEDIEEIEEIPDENVFINNTIMGNDAAQYYYHEFERFIMDSMNEKEREEYNEEYRKLYEMGCSKEQRRIYDRKLFGKLINRYYNELFQQAKKLNSRYAFQAIGVIILEHGAKLQDSLKTLILKNSHWKDERFKFKTRRDRIERKKYLYSFISEVLQYKEGEIIIIPWIP